MLDYEIENVDGKISIVVDKDQYEHESDFDYDPRVYELEERLIRIATNALEKPIWLNHEVTGECFVVHRWGTIEELKTLAAEEFEIVLS